MPPDAGDAGAALEQLYRDGYEIRPVLEAILRHPALYTGPRMVKPPVVYTAGLLRALGRGIDTTAWVVAGREARAAALLPAERGRAGTTTAGSTRRRSAAAGTIANDALGGLDRDAEQEGAAGAERRREAIVASAL